MQTIEDFVAATATGKMFTATFTKRTTGETRVMNCRTGVKKHLADGELPYDPAKAKLLPVYDLKAAGYRQISLDALISVKIEGGEYFWREGAFHRDT